MTCKAADYEDGEFTVLVINRVFGTFSLFGGLFIISCYLRFDDIRTFAFWLVFMVGIGDAGQAIGNMIGDPKAAGLCTFQAWMMSFFGISSLFWQTSIAFTMYRAFLKEDQRFTNQNIAYMKKYYLWVCWGIPALLTVCFAATYGDAYGLCWITEEYYYWRVVQFYLPLWLAISFNIYVYINIHKKMKILGAPEEITARLKYYPIVLVVAWGPDSVVFAIELFMGGKITPGLAAIAVTFASLEGVMNASVYGLTNDVRQKLAMFCSKEDDSQALLSSASASTPRFDAVFSEQTPNVNLHTNGYQEADVEDNEFGATSTTDL